MFGLQVAVVAAQAPAPPDVPPVAVTSPVVTSEAQVPPAPPDVPPVAVTSPVVTSEAQVPPAPLAASAPPAANAAVPVPPVEPSRAQARFSAKPGQGIRVESADGNYALTLRPRLQLRNELAARPSTSNEISVRTIRLWMLGHVLSPNIRFGIQLAFGPNDFEKGSASPIFDAYVEFAHLRDLQVRVGQFFVPFDRARTIREFALQTIDRAAAVTEFSLDRDVGVMLSSQDLFGLGGRLTYALGIFGGDGRNRVGTQDLGFLYTARVAWRPFGAFDEDAEGDLQMYPTPKLMIGSAVAHDQNTDRPRATTGTPYTLGTVDYTLAEADAVFKWRGWSTMAEVLYRYSPTVMLTGVDSAGAPLQEYTRRGWGYLLQTSYLWLKRFENWVRWDELRAPHHNDPQLLSSIASDGRTLSGGFNYYINGHAFKAQLDCAHSFGSDFGSGRTVVRLQFDATF